MMAPVMGKPRIIDDLLPGSIDPTRALSRPQRIDHRLESPLRNFLHREILVAHSADAHEPPERRVIARHAARKLEKHGLTIAISPIPPRGVFFSEPRARADERPEAGRIPACANHC